MFSMGVNHSYFDMDLTAPDLLPIDDFINDLTYPKDPELVSLQQEMSNLNSKMEQLILDSNTQALRVEIWASQKTQITILPQTNP